MSHAAPVALVGFSRFERATFESFFRLATNRKPSYQLTESLADCKAAIVNADDERAVADVRSAGCLARTLMLGARPQAGAATQLSRPINLMLVVRALDQVVLKSVESAAALAVARVAPAVPKQASAATPDAGVQRVLDDLAMVTGVLPASMDTRAMATAGSMARTPAPVAAPAARESLAKQPPASSPGPAKVPDMPRSRRQTMDHILVVDDSDVALRFMAQHLQRFGFEVHLARSGAEAIERVAKRHFELVFMDVMMEGLDGFHTCKAIKRATYPDDRPPPTVVMLTSRGTAVDKLRGTMAGADAYLTKPLSEVELLKVVGDREIERHAYVDTSLAANTIV